MIAPPLSRRLHLRVFGTGTAACMAGNVLLPLLCAFFALIPAMFLRRTKLFSVLTGERSLTRGRK